MNEETQYLNEEKITEETPKKKCLFGKRFYG